MKFDTPAGQNPIDQLKVVGQPVDRYEAKLKTTGTSVYAYEYHDVAPNIAYGYILGAAIAKGRIASMDTTKAEAAPGVVGVISYKNAGNLDVGKFYVQKMLAAPEVDHYHQAVAVVVAETFEQARSASALIEVQYEGAQGRFDLVEQLDSAPVPPPAEFGGPPEIEVGSFQSAFDTSEIKLDETYTVPDQAHAMMEPHATIASWDGTNLTCWTSIQQMNWGTRDLGLILGIPKENVRLISPFIGGGFGGKGTVQSDLVLAALSSWAVKRPVKIALQRPLMFNNTIHRPKTIQRIRLGASLEGKLTAIAHESWSGNLAGGRTEPTTLSTRSLYAAPNRLMRLRLATLDLAEGNAMRAPGEAPGLMALEIAMDEMAEKLGIDPVEFRIINDTQVDPEKPDRKFSTRPFIECLRTGSARFGWNERNTRPGEMRDGHWLVGMGMASAIRGAPIAKAGARARLDRNGVVTIETDMTDIGTGSYTIVQQTAAEMMGVPLESVIPKLGDSNFPETPGSGGQQGAPSVTAGVYAACVKLREAVIHQLGFNGDEVEFANGRVRSGDLSVPLASAAANGELVAEDKMEFGNLSKQFSQQTFGAHFAEVGVHAFTGEIRVRRMLAVCAAGRILNPKTARSQVIGGMTMGIGAAVLEDLAVDKKLGLFVNHDLAGYEVAVHADVPHLDAVFIEEVDPTMSPVKAKGVGELGLTGVAPAIANAVYNATGIRTRDYPITLDKFLGQMPAVA
ncbi:xanthine dehydrogenase molybdenum binding subunit apoprotein [Rhizobium sp. PP-WC-2G-219]|nr:xanthine dehydrogenase molybdenum binding subunit apoprotein [Rhizobium sp. PP-WC-2G-219]